MALRTINQGLKLPMRVWDAPTRLFHWALVLLVLLSYVSISINWIEIHLISGYCIAALLLFRLVWGFIGSETARFSQFLSSPINALRHLAKIRQPEPDTVVGHNAAGAWSVLAMLLALLVQVGTGLFANDDAATEGPLAKYVGKAWSDWLSGIHSLNFNIVMGLVGLHVLAITTYAVLKKQDLVRPMITGKKRLPAATRAPRMAHPLLAAVVLAAAGAAIWVIATRF